MYISKNFKKMSMSFLIEKKSLYAGLSCKTFRNWQEIHRKELCLLFEKSRFFFHDKHGDGPLSLGHILPVYFCSLFKELHPLHNKYTF